jgi:hypothetical protein
MQVNGTLTGMRNAGERRHRAAGPPQPTANGSASLFTPAYRVNHPDEVGADWDQQSQPLPGYTEDWSYDPEWPGSAPVRDFRANNAVRGFPPAPGEPLPVYPPGPFAAWNQRDAEAALDEPNRNGDRSRQLAAASITPVEFDTDFSIPAIRDPIASRTHSDEAPAESAVGLAGSHAASHTGSQITRQAPPSRTGRRAADHRGTRQKPRSKARRQSVRYAVVAAALIIVAVALVLVITAPRRSGPPTAGQSPAPKNSASASPSPARPPGKWGFIGLRSTDALPVSASELFPLSFTNAGIAFARVAATERSHCRAALIGAALQLAVRKAGCTQVVRATYVARAAKMMATVGVFNLKSAAKAGTASSAVGATQFVAQLKSKKGPAQRIGQGTGIEVAAVEGHYLLLGWAEHTGLSAPKTHAQRLALENFITVLIQRTASIALTYRLDNGLPMPH